LRGAQLAAHSVNKCLIAPSTWTRNRRGPKKGCALNMAAAALSRLAPVFRVEDPRHGRAKVAVNLATDRFARGATELRRGQGGALRDLSVRHGDLQSAVMLVKQAGLSFTFALSPQAPAVDLNQETPARPR
jgi:hypothetical protein